MKTGLPQISIGERVQAAQISLNTTNTSTVPSDINPSPGKSTITPIDTSNLDRAGGDIKGQAQQGNKATSDSARKGQSQAASSIQYPKERVDSTDQAPTAAKATDIQNTPQPRSKGFKESLIDQQMSSGMANRTGGDHPAPDRDYGHNNGDPNQYIGDQPESQPIRRNKMDPYSNQKNRVPEPQLSPITSFDKENGMAPYKAPKGDIPKYTQKGLKTPVVKTPNPRFNTPRFN